MQAAILFGRKAPLLVSLYANSGVETRLAVYGFLANFGARRFPKGNEGKRVSSGYNRRRRLATRSSGKQQAERTAVRTAPIVCPEESPLVRPQAHISCRGGRTRRLRRGRWGCRPEEGSTFFRRERKYQRKPAARRLREKALYCPFFERGSSQCRAQTSWIAISYCRARSCSLFSSFKKGKAFSLRCLSPLCSPAAGVGQAQPMRVGMLRRRLDGFAVSINRPVSQLTVGGGLT